MTHDEWVLEEAKKLSLRMSKELFSGKEFIIVAVALEMQRKLLKELFPDAYERNTGQVLKLFKPKRSNCP